MIKNKGRVLIVDDEIYIREILKSTLEEAAYECEQAHEQIETHHGSGRRHSGVDADAFHHFAYHRCRGDHGKGSRRGNNHIREKDEPSET